MWLGGVGGLRAFILVRERGQWGGVQLTHDLVQAGDLLFQEVVLLLCDLLPLLGDLQSLQQLSVLHVQTPDQHVRFPVLLQLEESGETVTRPQMYRRTYARTTEGRPLHLPSLSQSNQ